MSVVIMGGCCMGGVVAQEMDECMRFSHQVADADNGILVCCDALAEDACLVAAECGSEEKLLATFGQSQLRAQGGCRSREITHNDIDFGLVEKRCERLAVERNQRFNLKDATREVVDQLVGGVEMGVASKFLHAVPKRQRVVGSRLHQRGVWFVQITANAIGKKSVRVPLVRQSVVVFPQCATKDVDAGQLCLVKIDRLPIAIHDKESLFALMIDRDNMDVRNTMEHEASLCNVDHRGCFYENLVRQFFQSGQQFDHVGETIGKADHTPAHSIATGGIEIKPIVMVVGGGEPMGAVVAMDGDISYAQNLQVMFDDGDQFIVQLNIVDRFDTMSKGHRVNRHTTCKVGQ